MKSRQHPLGFAWQRATAASRSTCHRHGFADCADARVTTLKSPRWDQAQRRQEIAVDRGFELYDRLRDLLADGTADRVLPEPMVDGIVKVLAAWGWKQRPAAVVSIGSHSRPTLIADTARRIAAIGRLEYLGTVAPAPAPEQARRGNSAQRLRQVHDAFTISTDLAAAIAANQGPILLVDDAVDTGWTMTVAACLLRQAGAGAVLPFALAVHG